MGVRDFFSTIMLGITCAPALATAAESPPPSIPAVSVAEPPAGYTQMCRRDPAICEAANFAAVHDKNWTAKSLIGTLKHVNRSVNSAIRFREDRSEKWNAVPLTKGASGDCEDYALQKRHELIQAGFHTSNLLITVVLQPNGDGHAVLTVRTDRGDFILDNLVSKVLDWRDTRYRYLKRQSTANAGKWVDIIDDRPNIVAGNF